MTEAERFQLVAVRDAIDAIRRAFGAPGDHGYGTPQGDALFELYKQRAAVADALEAAETAERGDAEHLSASTLLARTRETQRAELQAAVLNLRGRRT